MIKAAQFTSSLEAQMAAEFLIGQGINAEINGAKEYSSLALGTDAGTFNVMVSEDKLALALAALKANQLQVVREEHILRSANSYFKRAILFAILGIVLIPLVANYASLRNLQEYLNKETRWGRKISGATLVLLLQIPSLFSFYFIVKAIRW